MTSTKIARWLRIIGLLFAALLASCGGGGGGGGAGSPTLLAMVDSFGQGVSESDFGGGDSGATGADGTAGDGVPIPNAPVTIVDSAGHSVSGKTDAQGYFRLRIDGFVPPMIANVVRPDGSRWYSPSLAAVKVRGFITINLTGLTDYIASQVAISDGHSGASELTPAILASKAAVVQIAKDSLNSQLTSQLLAAGLNPATFDAVTTPFRPNLTGYDAVLESVIVVKDSSGSTSLIPKYSLGGTISGLDASGLVLSNGADAVSIASGTSAFTFPTGLTAGTAYSVTVTQQPGASTCVVSNGTGTMGAAPVTGVRVACSSSTRSIGGSISGLGNRTGLALSLGAQTLQVNANASSFTFPANVPVGSSYDVGVQSQPAGAICSVSNGAGTVGATNVGSVVVTCSSLSFALGGTIAGLTTNGLILASGGQTVAPIGGATTFTFATPVASGSNYNVTVQQQPIGAACSVANGSGTVTGAAVTSVAVSCVPSGLQLGGSISGLVTGGLILANGTQNLSVSPGASSFVFPTPLSSGSSYNVTVKAQPAGTTCTISNGTGTMGAGTSVSIACNPNSFSLGGSVSGLTSAGLILATNTGQTLAVPSGATGFTFAQPLPYGTSYTVSVQTQPATNTCSVSNASGVMSSVAVTTVSVICSSLTLYSVGGSISGLGGNGLVLTTNGQQVAPSAGATTFTFPTPLAAGVSYSISVQQQPPGFLCSVSNGSGVIAGSAITGVQVGCSVAASGPILVSTLAGSGVAGSADGVGTAASFDYPSGLAIDFAGAVYVADGHNNVIRKITSGGVVTTFAGTAGPCGSADGTGSSASFCSPVGLAIDQSGNLYVADFGNHRIRKITPAGVVSTLAGSGLSGALDGVGAAATFATPDGIAVDGSNNVYVTDPGSNKIRKISPLGVVTTLAGSGLQGSADGTGAAASFDFPLGIATDIAGNVYVTEQGNDVIRKITPTGVVTTLAGQVGVCARIDGTGTAAAFCNPHGIARDNAGNFYVGDFGLGFVRKVTPGGVVTTFAGTVRGNLDGSGEVARFNTPTGIAVDGSGNVYVSDRENNNIRKISPLVAIIF